MTSKAHWEKVYGSKSPKEVSWYQAEPTVSLDLIRASGIVDEAPIIDVGGGASVLADSLLDEGFKHITVLDISGAALACARNRMLRKAAAINWIEADVTQFSPPQPFALWHDRAVFHFLTEEDDREKYAAALRQGLVPGGHLIVATFAKGGPERCSGLDIVQYDSDKLLGVLGSDFRLADQRTEQHLTPGGTQQKFAWFHLTREVA